MSTDIPPRSSAASEDELPRYDARDLLVRGTTAQIVLDGQVYVLRVTRANKLILTK